MFWKALITLWAFQAIGGFALRVAAEETALHAQIGAVATWMGWVSVVIQIAALGVFVFTARVRS